MFDIGGSGAAPLDFHYVSTTGSPEGGLDMRGISRLNGGVVWGGASFSGLDFEIPVSDWNFFTSVHITQLCF